MYEIAAALRHAPEVFVDIPGYEGYQVSNLGRVKSLDRFITRKNSNDKVIKGKILTPTLHKKGYYYVRLGSKGNQKHFYIQLMGIKQITMFVTLNGYSIGKYGARL